MLIVLTCWDFVSVIGCVYASNACFRSTCIECFVTSHVIAHYQINCSCGGMIDLTINESENV